MIKRRSRILLEGHWRACMQCRHSSDTQPTTTEDPGDPRAPPASKKARTNPITLTRTRCGSDHDSARGQHDDLPRPQPTSPFDNAFCRLYDKSKLRPPITTDERAENTWTCTICRTSKTIQQFDVRRLMLDTGRLWCTDCVDARKHVPCQICGSHRDNWGNGRKPFICTPCRYPPCVGCGKPRPQSGKYMITQLRTFRCKECRWPACVGCNMPRPTTTANEVTRMEIYRCEKCLAKADATTT